MFAVEHEFHLTADQIAMLISIPSLLTLSLSFGAGAIGLAIGIRATVGMAALTVCLSGILMYLADGYTSLLISRILLGIGSNLAGPNLAPMIGAWFTSKKRPIALGIYTTAIHVSDIINTLVTVPLLQILGSWRNPYLIYTTIMFAFMFMWCIIAKLPHTNFAQNGLESRRLQHISLKKAMGAVLKSKNIWCLSVATFFDNVAAIGIVTLIPIINLVFKGLDPATASFAAFPFYFGTVVAMLVWAPISSILQSRKITFILHSILTTMLYYLIILIPAEPLGLYMVFMFITGLLSAWFPPLNNTYIMELPEVGPMLSPAALGLTNFFGMGMGGFIGPLLMGYVPYMTDLITMYVIFMAVSTIFYFPLTETYKKKQR
jgi:MFS family permease